MERRRKTIDEYKFLVKFYMDNIELSPHELVKKSRKVDLIRNNFAKTVIYNYFLHTKRALKDGHRCKGFPEKLYELAMNYKKKEEQFNKDAIEPQKYIEKVTYEDIENQFLKDKDELEHKCLKIVEENRKKITMLEKMNDEISEYLQYKVELLIAKRAEDMRKLFERIGE